MVHRRRRLIALAAFTSTILLGGMGLLGAGLSNRMGPGEVPILASAPTSTAMVTTTVALPPTTSTTSTTSTTVTVPATVAPTTAPPATPAPRPPTTPPAPRPVPVTAAPRPVVTAAPRVQPVQPVQPPQSGGNPSDYVVFGYRWNPCQVVTVSSTGPDVSGVVAELASITGLHMQMVGSGGQITVGWGATPAGGEVGQTDWRSVGPWLDSAVVTLNPAGSSHMATLLRHELGHAVGLGHAAQSNEIMYGVVGNGSPTDYQAGDLAGLHAVGASAGC